MDPAAAEAIGPANGRRLVRALEVIELTGAPFGAGLPSEAELWRDTVTIGLRSDRAELVERLDRRVRAMWRAGLLDEVAALLPAGFGVTAGRAIGYAQAIAQLAGELDEQQAIEQTAALTRRYARRQVGWFGRYRGTRLDRGRRRRPRAAGPRDPGYADRVSTELRFTKGHGTGNDFVLFADPDGAVELDGEQLPRPGGPALRDRRRRRHPRRALGEPVRRRRALAEDPGAEWFMDYHNADGSPAEMCGNGIRVFAEFLIDERAARRSRRARRCRSARAAECVR